MIRNSIRLGNVFQEKCQMIINFYKISRNFNKSKTAMKRNKRKVCGAMNEFHFMKLNEQLSFYILFKKVFIFVFYSFSIS